jgi:lipoate synthase
MKLHLKNLDIGTLIRYQSISQTLLDEMVNNFNDTDIDFYMQNIGTYQKISRQFITRFKYCLSLRVLIRNKLIPRSDIHNIYGDGNGDGGS